MSLTPSTSPNFFYSPTSHLTDMAELPAIRGTWYFVDPYAGSNTNDGLTKATAFADLPTAYAAITSGHGDGIAVMSGGTAATAGTTSYLKQQIAWSADGVTVVGLAATSMFGWARVASKTVTSTSVAIVVTTTHTITDSAATFVTDGWVIGMKGQFDGANTNASALFTVATVSETVMTVTEALTNATVETHTLTSYCPTLIALSGKNNLFINLNLYNGSGIVNVAGIGESAVLITGPENKFVNCHLVCGAAGTATAYERSLELGAGAIDNQFYSCIIGTDTIDRGNNASCELYLNGDTTTTARNNFYQCMFLGWASTGTAHGAIKSAAASAIGRHMIFRDCDFICYTSGTDQISMFIGTATTAGKILLTGACSINGYGFADSSSSNHCVYLPGSPTLLTTGAGDVLTTKTT